MGIEGCVAPTGLVASSDGLPTAYAVGYALSPLTRLPKSTFGITSVSSVIWSPTGDTFRPLLRKDRAPARVHATKGEGMQIPRSLHELVMTSVAT